MDQFIARLLENISNQGLSLTFSVVAVMYLYSKIKECEADRNKLWERLLSITHHENHRP